MENNIKNLDCDVILVQTTQHRSKSKTDELLSDWPRHLKIWTLLSLGEKW